MLVVLNAFIAADSFLPKPPPPSQFEAYGFAGVIFGAFFFLVCLVLYFGWRLFTKRDELWLEQQEQRDQRLATTLGELSESHERAVARVATSFDRTAGESATVNREVVTALKDLQREVQQSNRLFGEETIASLFRRALREVQREKG